MSARPPRTVDELRGALRAAKAPGVPMLAKHDGECGLCGQAILKGDVIAWLPADRTAACAGCAADWQDQ